MSKLLTFLLLLIFSPIYSETISFDITIFGNVIGKMDITRSTDKEGNENYLLLSKSKAKVLWIVREGLSKFEASYKNGKLISCSHLEIENNKIKRSTKVIYDGKNYQVETLNQPSRSFSEVPEQSDITMYFSDSKNLKRIFYLPDASFYTLTSTASNTLEFKSSDGHRNVYLFENGKITSMEFHLGFATVYMHRLK